MTSATDSSKKFGTLLVLSTYPIRRPRHGGQIRSAALMTEYKKVFNKVVRSAVFNSSVFSPSEIDRGDIPSPPPVTQDIVETPELEAWYLGESPMTSPEVKRQITQLLKELTPEAIVFEQVYLYLGMKDLLDELDLKIPLIYSSHNVESEMMRDIFKTNKMADKFDVELVRLEEMERDLVSLATGTIAVSSKDAEVFRAWGSADICVAGNGTYPLRSSFLKRLRIRRLMRKLNISSFALLVASSHQPNVSGFIDVLGTRLGYIPENSMIFIAGDLCRALYPAIDKENPKWGNLFWSRVFNWDRVSNSTLSALLSEANCILLPITSGGGSNLKTAEALSSGKQVIATSIAMRGFEDFTTFEKDSVAETNEEFRNLLIGALNSAPHSASPTSTRLSWDSQLEGIKDWYFKLLGEK